MRIFILHVALSLAWGFVTGDFRLVNLAFGAVTAWLAILVARPLLPESPYYSLPLRALRFLLQLLKDLLVASSRLVIDVLTPTAHFQPRLVAVPLGELSPAEITLFANSISLTPGTLVVDVSPDRRWLHVHAMYAENVDRTIRELAAEKQRRVVELIDPRRLEGGA